MKKNQTNPNDNPRISVCFLCFYQRIKENKEII